MLGACGKKDLSNMKEISDISEISNYKDVLPSDTMMFYFGQMQAANYWQDAETDTLLRTEEARRDFMAGLRTAMAMDEDNEAYNKGLQLGMRLAVRLREFERRYNQEFSEEVFAASLQNYLKNDMRDSIAQAQKGFYNVKDRLELQAAKTEASAAKEYLAKMGDLRGFEMISDTLFALDVTPLTGPCLKEGDRLAVEVTASTLDGKEITTRQFPDSITLGEGRVPAVVKCAILTMSNGQTRQFMTTPRTLFGKRYATFNLPYDEPVIFTVKAIQN